MVLTEAEAIRIIDSLIEKNFQDYDLIIKEVLGIKEDSFSDNKIKKRFKDLCDNFKKIKNWPLKDVNYLINELKTFKAYYNQYLIKKEKEKGKPLLNEAGQLLKQGQILTRREELLRLARRCGYPIDGEDNEGTRVLTKDQTRVLDVIPRHNDINRDLARSIMRRLMTGTPTFRKKSFA